jgi:hypothetical protein
LSYENPWQYKGKVFESEDIGDNYGFIYRITNSTNGHDYIGRKFFWTVKKRPPLKGKKNKRRGTKESDWRDYWGSSDHLNADVKELGPDKFTREILYYCNSRGLMSYLEAREQFERRVLESDEYYNGIINVRVGSSKILKEALQNLKAI